MERRQKYLAEARHQKIWESPQWQRLGHYRERWGQLSSPLQGAFFLSQDGPTKPQSELEKTIEVLFSESSTTPHPQCKYLARTKWLTATLNVDTEDLVPCPEQTKWKEELGAKELYLVFAASDLNSASSSFGHTFLRAHNPKNTNKRDLLDYGVNYAAVTGTESGALYAAKGLLGAYPGAYSMQPYHQKLREYTNLEGRNIWEYKLALTPEEVEIIIDHLLELEGSFSPYYFLSDNCSQQILELIEVGRPNLQLSSQFIDATIPLDTVKVLAKNKMLSHEQPRTSLQAQWRSYYKVLDSEQVNTIKKIVASEKLVEMNADTAKKQAETLEAALSYLAIREYQTGKKLDQLKYDLALKRASLGPVTNPIVLETPSSPLLSQSSVAFYLGVGQEESSPYLRFKFRRAFHDLLSEDSGLSTFSHLEVLGLDFRYFTDDSRARLQQLTLLKMFNSPPTTAFESPSTWKIELGADSELWPYAHWGWGLSKDFPTGSLHRASLLFINENYQLTRVPAARVGVETLVMSKWHALFRSVVSASSVYAFQEKRQLERFSVGISWGTLGQYRLETQFGELENIQFSMLF